MHNLTIPLTDQFLANLRYLGAREESAQIDMARRLIAEYMDDIALGSAALATADNDFVGTEAGATWLQSIKNAED